MTVRAPSAARTHTHISRRVIFMVPPSPNGYAGDAPRRHARLWLFSRPSVPPAESLTGPDACPRAWVRSPERTLTENTTGPIQPSDATTSNEHAVVNQPTEPGVGTKVHHQGTDPRQPPQGPLTRRPLTLRQPTPRPLTPRQPPPRQKLTPGTQEHDPAPGPGPTGDRPAT